MTYLLAGSALLLILLLWLGRDWLRQLAAGFTLRTERLLAEGDWIQLEEGPVGKIKKLRWRVTILVTAEGQELLIPNRRLLESVVRRFVHREPWARRRVVVHCPDTVPPAQVQKIIQDSLRDCEGMVPPPLVLNQGACEGSIEYAVDFLISELVFAVSAESTVRNRIWYALDRNGIRSSVPAGREPETGVTPETGGPMAAEEMDRRKARLRQVDLFADLDDETLSHLARAARTVWYTPGETIIRQGEEGEEFFLIHAGELLVVADGSDGQEREMNRLGPGQFFGELSLLTGQRRSATVKALHECELIVLGKKKFAPILDRTPALVASIQRTLETRQTELKTPGQGETAADEPSDSLAARFLKNFHLRW